MVALFQVLLHHGIEIRAVRHPRPSVVDAVDEIKVVDARLCGVSRRMDSIDSIHAGTVDALI